MVRRPGRHTGGLAARVGICVAAAASARPATACLPACLPACPTSPAQRCPTLPSVPTLQECVVEPLLPHFLQFYEADERATPPLKFEKCARLQVGRVAEAARQGLVWMVCGEDRLGPALPLSALALLTGSAH